MKKLLSIIMAAVMAVSVSSTVAFSASANTMATAVAVSENQIYETSVCGTVDEYVKSWVRFDCTTSGYYEIVCDGLTAPDGPVHITVYDSSNNIVNYAVNTSGAMSFSAVTYLDAGCSYYYCVEIDGTLYNCNVSVKKHNHIYTNVQQIKALADDTSEIRRDGFTRFSCVSCNSFYDTAVCPYPASVALSQEKYTFDGTNKYPSVTVYNRAGAVIPSSEYTVTYEDNVLPGKAFVIISFNSYSYEGEMTKSFSISPQKQSVTYLNSKKSNSITVKWTRDNNVSGYEIQYSTSPKFYKSKTKTIEISKKSATSKTIDKLQGNKKYYVRVRSYKTVDSVRIYGAWSNKQYVKTKK
ncbi:MAG: fibronectin type III domain-containing protein [Eubacterium sp.]